MVVDDEQPLRDLIAVALQAVGHHVVTAGDGATAIAAFRGASPDVVLLDLMLPDVKGFGLLDKMTREGLDSRAPVLVVTARDEPRIIADALNRGAHDLVIKPFGMSELIARVDAAVRVKREHDHLVDARAALRRQVTFTDAVMDTIASIVVVLDPDGHVVRFNRAAEQISGFREEELAGLVFWDTPLLADGERDLMVAAHAANVAGTDAPTRIEGRWRPREGGQRVISWSNTTLLGPDAEVEFCVGTGVDITDLRDADKRLHACLDVMPTSILLLDPVRDAGGQVVDFQLRYLNRAAEAMLPKVALGSSPESGSRQLMTDDQFELLVSVVEVGSDVEDEAEVELDGHTFTFAYSVARLGDGVVLSLRDVTDRRAIQDQLAWAASHDPLTGLAGRTLLVDRLQRALAHRRTARETVVGVLFVDLDGFKAVNDGLGHAAGDRMLVAVARALEATVRPVDTVARYGGDEFVVIAEDLPSADEVALLADRLGTAVAGISLDGYRLRASVGLAIAGDDDDPDAILRLADDVMYEKKRHSR